ncbi:MAG: hypothetical protein V9G04_02435 [Nocardioides sp.]|jgi:hypothetical protein
MTRETYQDADLLAALRAAAVGVEGPLSVQAYAIWQRRSGGPTSARIIQRLGSWSAALRAAGLAARTADRTYHAKWDEDAVLAAVRVFLAAGGPSSYAAYADWSRDQPDAPSAQTVRNLCGGWAEAKRRAGD